LNRCRNYWGVLFPKGVGLRVVLLLVSRGAVAVKTNLAALLDGLQRLNNSGNPRFFTHANKL
jgi:hypothetical protein